MRLVGLLASLENVLESSNYVALSDFGIDNSHIVIVATISDTIAMIDEIMTLEPLIVV